MGLLALASVRKSSCNGYGVPTRALKDVDALRWECRAVDGQILEAQHGKNDAGGVSFRGKVTTAGQAQKGASEGQGQERLGGSLVRWVHKPASS